MLVKQRNWKKIKTGENVEILKVEWDNNNYFLVDQPENLAPLADQVKQEGSQPHVCMYISTVYIFLVCNHVTGWPCHGGQYNKMFSQRIYTWK